MTRPASLGRFAVVFLLGCCVGSGTLHLYRGRIVPGKQVRNLAHMQFWQAVLSDVEQQTGSYPASLEEALASWKATGDSSSKALTWDPLQDGWGHPFIYARRPGGYILASFGRDGRCDMWNIEAYSPESVLDESPCYAADRDTVLTDRGFVKGCGK